MDSCTAQWQCTAVVAVLLALVCLLRELTYMKASDSAFATRTSHNSRKTYYAFQNHTVHAQSQSGSSSGPVFGFASTPQQQHQQRNSSNNASNTMNNSSSSGISGGSFSTTSGMINTLHRSSINSIDTNSEGGGSPGSPLHVLTEEVTVIFCNCLTAFEWH
jgi:hypothetical protein